MGLVLKKDTTAAQSAQVKASAAQTSAPADDDFVVPTPEEVQEDIANDGDGSSFYKLEDGPNYLLILPVRKSWELRYPWITNDFHGLWKDIDKILGYELPSEISRKQTCAISAGGSGCDWCKLVTRLKNGGRGPEAQLAQVMRKQERSSANVVGLRDGGNRAVQPFEFGWSIRKELRQALSDGETFCDPMALIPVRITKTGTGLNTRYDVKVMVSQKKRFQMTPEWAEAIQDLRELVTPPLPSSDVRAIIDQLFSSGGSPDADNAGDFADDDMPF